MNFHDLLAGLLAVLLAATGSTLQTDDPRQPWVVTIKPAPQKPTAKPTPTKPATTKPAKPQTKKPATRKPAVRKPAPRKPAVRKPAPRKPAAKKPAPPKPTRKQTQKPLPPAGSKPADVLNLANWKLTLPIGEDEKPTEIKQPALDGFAQNPYFVVQGNGVRFRSPVDGVTTGGSSYPRSELREMTDGGRTNAAWSATEGTHTMVVDTAITHLPKDKPHVVAAQIHGGDDDVTVFRLEGSKLYLTNGDEPHYKLITSNYRLGQRFQAKFVVNDGEVKAYYNGTQIGTVEADFDGGYFKAGAYTQANCEKSSPCDASNYGEAVIYTLTSTHS